MNLENVMEKGMATHSSILAWETPCTEEPSGLQYIGSQRVRPYSAINTFSFEKIMLNEISQTKQATYCMISLI